MHGFDSNWPRMNEQQRQEARALFGALFGEPQQQEAPPVQYDPANADKQSFLQTLLVGDGEAMQRFQQHQAQLEQEQIDRGVDNGTISPNSPAGQESLRRRQQNQNPQEAFAQRHVESMRRMGLYR